VERQGGQERQPPQTGRLRRKREAQLQMLAAHFELYRLSASSDRMEQPMRKLADFLKDPKRALSTAPQK